MQISGKYWKGLTFCLLLLQLSSMGKNFGRDHFIFGAKIYEYSGSLPRLFSEWHGLNFNAAFVGTTLYSRPEFRNLARKEGIDTFVIFPVFFDADQLAKRPGLFSITQNGEKAKDDWVQFVCPTRREYLNEKIVEIQRLIREYDPDGISLDFIRYFVFWEMVHPGRTLDSLPNSCFDSSCLRVFQEAAGIKVPSGLVEPREKAQWILSNHFKEWTQWKCQWMAQVVESLAMEARKAKPTIKINIHTIPWRKADFGEAIRSIAGQDLSLIAPFTDYISPMCYFHMVRQTPDWVHSVTEDAASLAHKQVIPSIQVQEDYVQDPLTPAAFRESLLEALKPPSHGVVFWSWEGLEKSPGKKEIVKNILCHRLSQAASQQR